MDHFGNAHHIIRIYNMHIYVCIYMHWYMYVYACIYISNNFQNKIFSRGACLIKVITLFKSGNENVKIKKKKMHSLEREEVTILSQHQSGVTKESLY